MPAVMQIEVEGGGVGLHAFQAMREGEPALQGSQQAGADALALMAGGDEKEVDEGSRFVDGDEAEDSAVGGAGDVAGGEFALQDIGLAFESATGRPGRRVCITP